MRVAAFTLALLACAPAGAQGVYRTPERAGTPSSQPTMLNKLGIDQKVGEQVPLELEFRDERGKPVQLKQYFTKGRPVILALVYYDCPMLCHQVLNGLTTALLRLKFDAGKEFDVLAVSFDPRETPELARANENTYVNQRYKRAGAAEGWHFLTGDQKNIDALTKAVGFRYAWDEHSKQWAHGSGIMVLTPEGRLAQYFYGIEYWPKDLRLALVESSRGKIGNVVDQVMLYCYHYDPTTGKYGAVVMNMLRVGAAVTLLILGTFLTVTLRREHALKTGQA